METPKTVVSEKFSLSWRDFTRGLLIAVIASVLTVVESTLSEGRLDFNWKEIGITAAIAGVAYISKNLFLEPAKVITITDSNTQAKVTKQKMEDLS